jgi:hypothetical protein
MTSGSQICNGTCTGYGTCGAAAETCNFCDDVGDGGDDRSVAATQTGSGTASAGCPGLTAEGDATCPSLGPATVGTMGDIFENTQVRVGWDTVTATATVQLVDTFADGFAPDGTLTLTITNDWLLASMRREVNMIWDVGGSDTVALTRVIGTSTTTMATWARVAVGWNSFDTDESQVQTITLEYRTALDGADQQVRFSIGGVTSPWTSSTGSPVLGPGTRVRARVASNITTRPYAARLQGGSMVSIQAQLTCP